MNSVLASIAAGAFVALIAGSAAAQDAKGDTSAAAGSAYTAKNVSRTRPFGLINVYNVGVDAKLVSAWAKKLSAADKQEMVGRCSVILQHQQDYFWETATFCQNFAIAMVEGLGKNGTTSQ